MAWGDRGEDGEAHQGGNGDGGGSEEAVRVEGRSTELGDPGATVAAFLGARQTQKRERGSREGRRRLGADLKWPGARGARSHDTEWGRLRHVARPGSSEERGGEDGADKRARAVSGWAWGRGRLPGMAAGPSGCWAGDAEARG